MGGAEDHVHALVLADDGAGSLQLREQMLRKPQSADQLHVILAGLGVDQAAGGGVGVLVDLHAAEAVHQPAGEHQEVRGAFQTARQQVRVKLIDRVEGLELDAGVPVQLREGDQLMHPGDHVLRSAVPVAVAGEQLPVALHEDVVHAPGVDGQAPDVGEQLPGLFDACLYRLQQTPGVPDQVPVLPDGAVREAIDFFCFQLAVLSPAHDVAAGGGADINGKIVLQAFTAFTFDLCVRLYRKKPPGKRGGVCVRKVS